MLWEILLTLEAKYQVEFDLRGHNLQQKSFLNNDDVFVWSSRIYIENSNDVHIFEMFEAFWVS